MGRTQYRVRACWLHGPTKHRVIGGHAVCMACAPRRRLSVEEKKQRAKERGLKYRQRMEREQPEEWAARRRRGKRRWQTGTFRGRASSMFHAAQFRAKRDGRQITVSLPEVVALLRQALKDGSVVIGANSPLTASLDRIDPSLGYTPENVQVVPAWYNLGKKNYGETAFVDAVTRWATARRG